MPGTGARANELRSNTIKTQPFGQRAGLLQMHPVGAHPLCPERVPGRMNYAPNPIKTQPPSARGWPPTKAPCRRSAFMLGTGARANELRA